jgi:hypothetical protein
MTKIRIEKTIKEMYKRMSKEERKTEIAVLRVETGQLNKKLKELIITRAYIKYLKRLNK